MSSLKHTKKLQVRIIQTTATKPKAKLLYLSGYAREGDGTFDALFSKSTIENNFKELFRLNNIETFAAEYDRTDTHEVVFNTAKKFVIENNIDYVFGFCYGSFPVLHCCVNTQVKGAILLDTSTTVPDWSNEAITSNLTERTPRIALDKIQCPVKLFYSEWGSANNHLNKPNGLQAKYIKNISVEVIPNSTHAIMLEEQRFTLMNKIMEFIDA